MKYIFSFFSGFLFLAFTACNNDGNKIPQKSDTASVNKDSLMTNSDTKNNNLDIEESLIIKLTPEQVVKDGPWRNDCKTLVNKLAKLATKETVKVMEMYNDLFKNKEVVWKLGFKSIEKDDKGEESLHFDEEPLGIRHKFFSGKPVMMSFKPASETYQNWKNIKLGTELRISAVVEFVYFFKINDNPVAQISLKNVKIIQN